MATPYLTCNGQSLEVVGALHVESYDDLLSQPDTKGEDRPIPGAHGDRPYPRWVAAGLVQLPLWVYGNKTLAGGAHGGGIGASQGLVVNARALPAALGAPTPDDAEGAEAVEAVFHDFAGGTVSADVLPRLSRFVTRSPGVGFYVLELVVPAGVFA
jgi:hypothetical protein